MIRNDIHWILVAGAHENLSKEHKRAAETVGRMLGRAGYGLIVGRWSGVDYLVTRSFRDAVGREFSSRFLQIDTTGGPERAPKPERVSARRLLDPRDPDGFEEYSEAAVLRADAGLVVPGCIDSKPAMDALLRKSKPVLPIAHLGSDAFEVYVEILDDWNNLPIRKRLTRGQFLELSMPSRRISTVEHLLFAALQTKPVLFVSYRHADVPHAAARIAEMLIHRYGRRSVFIDVDGLEPGRVFSTELVKAIRGSRAVVPIIGPKWEGPKDAKGMTRIEQPNDWIKRELLTARDAGAAVLPIMVQRSSLGSVLPESLRWLSPIQRTEAHYADVEHDLRPLFEALDAIVLPRQRDPKRARKK